MAVREVDAISDAIIETEREIAGEAWGQEDTQLDASGDRSLEEMGEGLEGQHEPGDDGAAEGDDSEVDEESEGKGEEGDEGDGQEGEAGKTGEPDGRQNQRTQQPEGRVPAGRLREANDRARSAETERDALKGQLGTLSEKLDLALRRIDDLQKGAPQRQEPPAAAVEQQQEAAPDLFEDPKGFADHLKKNFQSELSKRDQHLAQIRVENSMALAHVIHKETFDKAFEAISKLDARNPEDRATVQRIYSAPNPGEALVSWHKRNETLARVGNDPAAYEDRIRTETRQALMSDPEFRKQLLAELRGEAERGDNGAPRTTNRLPKSLNRAAGSNLGGERIDPRSLDDSEQSVADAAWR